MKLLAFGEVLFDIINGKHHLGGAPLNFAAHVVKCGGSAAVVSAVGNDELGALALKQIQTHQVDTAGIRVLTGVPTSTVDVFLKDGQPDYTIHEGVSFDHITLPEPAFLKSVAADVFYFGTLAQRSAESRSTLRQLLEQSRFSQIFFDINLRKNFYTREIVEYSLHHCTIFKINDVEAKMISGLLYNTDLSLEAFAGRIAQDYTLQLVIITAGENGCYVWKAGRFTHVIGEKVQVADAVGAGDAFGAAFLFAYLKDGSEIRAARIGNIVGGFVASQHGAIPEYSPEIKDLLR